MGRTSEPMARSNALVEWVLGQLHPLGPWRSPREWSIRIGRGHSYVTNVLDLGRATPEGLAAMADSVGASRLEVFRLAGWLRDEDISQTLAPEEQSLLDTFRLLPEERRSVLLSVAGSLREQTIRG